MLTTEDQPAAAIGKTTHRFLDADTLRTVEVTVLEAEVSTWETLAESRDGLWNVHRSGDRVRAVRLRPRG